MMRNYCNSFPRYFHVGRIIGSYSRDVGRRLDDNFFPIFKQLPKEYFLSGDLNVSTPNGTYKYYMGYMCVFCVHLYDYRTKESKLLEASEPMTSPKGNIVSGCEVRGCVRGGN